MALNKKNIILGVANVAVALILVTLNTNNQPPVLENKELIHVYKYRIYSLD